MSSTSDPLLRESIEAQKRGDFDAMLDAAERASELAPSDMRATFRLLESLLFCGHLDRVRRTLAEVEKSAERYDRLHGKIGEFYMHCGDHQSAYRCFRRAVDLVPNNPEYLLALAGAEVAIGSRDDAEEHINEAIRLNPHEYHAYLDRAALRKQSRDENHIEDLLARLTAGARVPAGQVQLCYALAKEYEDLGDHATSFEYLKRGADTERSIINYEVEGDVAVMERLQGVFDEELLGQSVGCEDTGPIFIVGLPDSGTEFVDQILSAHSAVDSLGEISNLAYAMIHTLGRSGDKLALVDASADMDYSVLGHRYINATRSYGRPGPMLIDKTPLNFLNIGLIHLALPNAKIIHVRRDPMDACYGMYRTLFESGHLFSYDFDDIARYYVAYSQLMDHWGKVVGDAFLDIRYEDLVDDQEATSRKMIDYCGLDWEDALDVRREPAVSWRCYEAQLQPLRKYLLGKGVGGVDTA